jgi:hypothetical protein
VNGEEGVIGGGGVVGEELSVIVRERGEERREEKGRNKGKKKKKKLQREGCRAVARPPPRCQGWWPSHPLVPKGVAFLSFFFFFLLFLKKIKNLIRSPHHQ